MNKNRWWCAAVSGALMLLCGCQADIHYQAAAVERARKFLLQDAVKELDLEQQSFVRYSDPVLLHAPCIGQTGISTDGNLKSELRQICVVWNIPGKDQLYMVFGVSSPRMSDWYPNRLLKKSFRKRLPGVEVLMPQVIAFARLNLMDKLTVAEMNHIRYTLPALALGAFPVKAQSAAKGGKFVQYALIWQLGDRSIVFTGLVKEGDKVSSWQCESAGFYSAAECAGYTRKLLTSQENAFEFALPAAAESVR